MLRSVLFALLLLLAGCCSAGSGTRDRACEASWERSRAAAGRGWDHATDGLEPEPRPTPHEEQQRDDDTSDEDTNQAEAEEAEGQP